MKNIVLIFFVANCFFSCSAGNEKKQALQTNQVPAAPYSGIDLDSRLVNADSLVFVFYDNPFTDDSLRYTRYYKLYSSTDSSGIKSFLSALALPFTKLEKVKPCRSEGKVWVFKKGRVFQTIYFAWSKNDCAFVYLIKDGFFYYMDIQQPFINTLLKAKTLAKNALTVL